MSRRGSIPAPARFPEMSKIQETTQDGARIELGPENHQDKAATPTTELLRENLFVMQSVPALNRQTSSADPVYPRNVVAVDLAGSGGVLQKTTGTDNENCYKSDTCDSASFHPQNENPGALAGATGGDKFGTLIGYLGYRKRAEAATALCFAIADCDPDDASVILDAALTALRQKAAFGGNPHFREAVSHYRTERTRSGGMNWHRSRDR